MATTSKQHLIQILNLKSSQLTTLPDSGQYFSPRWSPDGRFVVVVDGGSWTLELYDFAQQNWEKLTGAKGGYEVWSKDGRCIYFNNTTDAKLPEYRLCLSDRKPQLVANVAEAGPITMGDFPEWTGITPDGWILAARDIQPGRDLFGRIGFAVRPGSPHTKLH